MALVAVVSNFYESIVRGRFKDVGRGTICWFAIILGQVVVLAKVRGSVGIDCSLLLGVGVSSNALKVFLRH